MLWVVVDMAVLIDMLIVSKCWATNCYQCKTTENTLH